MKRIFSASPALLVWAAAYSAMASGDPAAESPYESARTIARAMQLIRQDYVEESQTGYSDLSQNALRGMLSALDPHSQFLDPEEFQTMQEDTKSEFGGLGIVVSQRNGVLTVVNPMEDSPAFDAGILPGDQILKINGLTTDRLTLREAIESLRGEVGAKVTLTISRPADKSVRDFELVREVIRVPSVKDATILPATSPHSPKIGYVRITQFNEPTAAELGRALDTLESRGMDALVLDLRYNPGGLLSSAVDVAAHFLPPETLVAFTSGRSPSREYRTGKTAPKGPRRSCPMVVLANYASASGSEIVAGALKDLRRALVIGETTFGKGSVQSVVALPDGSAVRLTTARYFTPGRNMIHEHGVDPDIRVTLNPDEEAALLKSRRRGETSPLPPSPPFDPQLSRAVDVLRGSILHARAGSPSAENTPAQ